MKRILSMILAFVMVLSLVPMTAFAADSPSITATADKTEAAIGDTIEVTFTLTNNPGFNNADFCLVFDHNVLQFTGLKINEDTEAYEGRFGGGITEINTIVGNAKYGTVLNARSATTSTDGKLFVAQFTVIGAGSTTVGVTVNALQDVADDGAVTDHTGSVAVTASAEITVAGTPATSVTLDKTALSLEEGSNYLLTATVEPTDTTDEIVWSSSDESVATVVNGQVKAVAAGTATITARANDSAYAECAVTVTAEQSIVRVGSTTAEMTGVKSLMVGGSTKTVKNIYKLPMNGHEDTTVYIAGSSIMGMAYKLDGTAVFGVPYGTDLSEILVNGTWASANTADLLVTEEALTAAVGAENVANLGLSADKLYAFLYTEDSGANRNCGLLFEITPVAATGVEVQETMELYEGETGDLSVSVLPTYNTDGLTVTYRSANTGVATVDENGKVTGVAPGTAIITVTAGEYTDTCTVTVKSGYVEIENIPGNGDTWKGSVTGITIKDVTVDSYQWNGKTLNVYIADDTATATAIFNFNKNGYDEKFEETAAITNGSGTLSKTFTYNDGWEGYDITWVVNFMKSVPATSIVLDKTTLKLTKGSDATLVATMSEGATDTVTWSTSDESVATVDKNGKVTAVGGGTATITATAHEGLTATCTVNVPTLYSVQDIPQVPTFKYGTFEITSLEIDANVESAAWDGDTLNVVLAEGTATDAAISTIWTVKAQNTWFAQDEAHYFFNGNRYGQGATPVTNVHTLAATLTDGAGTATATFEGRGTDCCDDQACDLSFPAKTYTVNFTVAEAGGSETPVVEGYTVTMPADISIVTGETASIPVVVDNADGSAYNAFDMSFTYDASKLELTSTEIEGMTVTDNNGTVRVQRYGSDLSVGAAAFTLTFEAIGTGEATVTATAAKVGIAENAHELDAADATILDDATVITIGGYSVNLPDDFTGESTVAPGKDYTFEAKDKNYNYDVTAKIGDTEITVNDNGDGTFTIPADQITGNIVITSTKEGKTFDVSLGDDMTGETSAQYMTPYTATLTKVDGYTYDLKVTIGGKDYTGFEYNEETGVVTIPGADITGKVEFNSNKTQVQPSEYTVTFEGNGAGDAVGENKVAPGADYSFTLNKAEGYTYTVSYKMGDSTESVALTEADGKYTIEKVNGNLVITVEKESDLAVKVGAYVEMDGKTVFLVRATGTLADGKAYAYKGDTMYYSNVYKAWSWLVIVEEGNTFTADDAKTNITAVEAEYTTLDQTFNVNMTSKVDVNDAQLVYNIYNCEYDDFSVATMQKFLYADTNGDKIVDTLDAAAVVNNIP